MGHWLGLRHIWGDTYCGDDLVDDTPKQGNFTSGCPSSFRSSCNNGTTTGDMYMNYMDYTADACVNLFTEGQKQRMLALFNNGGPRHSFLNSNGLKTPWNLTIPEPVVEAPVVNEQFKIYPNPSASSVMLNFEFDETWIGKTLSVVNLNGIEISRVVISSKTQKLDVSSFKPGMYFIQGVNGNKKIRKKLVKL